MWTPEDKDRQIRTCIAMCTYTARRFGADLDLLSVDALAQMNPPPPRD